jgi:hypothetical protein
VYLMANEKEEWKEVNDYVRSDYASHNEKETKQDKIHIIISSKQQNSTRLLIPTTEISPGSKNKPGWFGTCSCYCNRKSHLFLRVMFSFTPTKCLSKV